MTRSALCLVALAVALASAGAAPAATPGVNGHLLVASGPRHEMTLFAMQPRNNGDRLMLNYGTDQGATYSPELRRRLRDLCDERGRHRCEAADEELLGRRVSQLVA
ncbi:MAG: hypothetical protein E6G33_04540 [Actinobacteria bacterium]|nr:MAG: hypothetical protein E6G33_04540 [Actinomycetota bacterium]